MSTKGEQTKRDEAYDGDELGIGGESEWERYGRAVVREGRVDDCPDLNIVGGCRRANWDDQHLVWRRALPIDDERELLALGGCASELEGICGSERGKKEKES